MTPEHASIKAREVCELAPVIPVLVIHDASIARPLAEALVAGGLPALEVTLRTPAALDVIREMASVDGGVVGAGTLLTPADVDAAVKAGAKFGVSPGATDTILQACEDADLPLLPGAATSSEVMRLMERGYTVQKFFPAVNFSAIKNKSFNRAIVPSSFMISTITPAGSNPASRAKSIAASVCPALRNTPPLLALRGKI